MMSISRLDRVRAAVALQLAKAPANRESDRRRLVGIARKWIALADARDAGRPDTRRETALSVAGYRTAR
jgi:hypothetical protein